MIPPAQHAVLYRLTTALADLPFAWAVAGSTGMALQGVPLDVHDIDLQTSAAGAYAIGERLAAFAVTPVREKISPHIRSHLGAFVVDGLIVEVLGGVQKRIDGVWEAPVDVDVHRRWVPLEGLTVPVLSLAYEEQAYRALGRIERADLLRDWLQGRPQTPGS